MGHFIYLSFDILLTEGIRGRLPSGYFLLEGFLWQQSEVRECANYITKITN